VTPPQTLEPNFWGWDGQGHRFSEKALGCLDASNPVRIFLAKVATHWAFDAVILFAILLNASFMGMVDYTNVNCRAAGTLSSARAEERPHLV